MTVHTHKNCFLQFIFQFTVNVKNEYNGSVGVRLYFTSLSNFWNEIQNNSYLLSEVFQFLLKISSHSTAKVPVLVGNIRLYFCE